MSFIVERSGKDRLVNRGKSSLSECCRILILSLDMKEESQTQSVPPPLKGSLLSWSSQLKEYN